MKKGDAYVRVGGRMYVFINHRRHQLEFGDVVLVAEANIGRYKEPWARLLIIRLGGEIAMPHDIMQNPNLWRPLT